MSSAMTDAAGVEAPNSSAASAQFRTPDLLTRSTVLRHQIRDLQLRVPERPPEIEEEPSPVACRADHCVGSICGAEQCPSHRTRRLITNT